ncbi:signal recognition particle 9 kDa protein [Amblyraja radiata]|uniref:signal recognition particle 9 kDa protein n=1 Tax=Amblyraja radiata TaxID=386614 RepID=UPI001402CB43|nr:signal recognition particle 9 kDa protein [Amblyraja radiata]
MTYIPSWEEFVRAAEKLCITDLMKVRVVIKYRHCAGLLSMKVTNDVVCLQYKTDQAQDVKKFEKFQNQLMRLMVSRECRSNLMEME